ncbi:GNAT family N-acetyltransferase [Ruficoccus amylovorans]|uniref:GNAT family N-acetyltransferase n=1 Tax=Ruficoccus amylovorans TaxID=1804625 RepID=A0A842HCN4_9BACT|nr:GNAT family N-acetyltransferase [Ruficoccus amylovorans]MBC2593367.1 GNAT family N-acetyltransferase [Ruficoccus amylovorans]
MAVPLIIDAMRAGDIPAAIQVQQASFEPHLLESRAVFEDRFGRFGEFFLVVREGDELVGYALAFPWLLGTCPENDRPFPAQLPKPDCFYLHDITLLARCRGAGTAVRMLASISEMAVTAGFECLSLVSVAQAGGYWDRQGFTELEGLDVAVLEKILASYGEGSRLMVRPLLPA